MIGQILKPILMHAGHEHGAGGGHTHDHDHTIKSGPVPMVEGLMEFSVVKDANGAYKNAYVEITEAGRSVEHIVIGLTPEEAMLQTMRICGVCPFPYAFAGAHAAEGLFQVVIPRKAYLLRKLGLYANHYNSHVLHTLDLVLPKLAGVNSVIEVAAAFPSQAKRILALHKLGNDMAKLAMGREVHAITIVLGGVSSSPAKSELRKIKQRFENSLSEYQFFAELYKSFADTKLRDFNLPKPEFIALKSIDGKYPLYEGNVHTSLVDHLTPEQLAKDYLIEEYSDMSNAKFVQTKNSDHFKVGALARLNLNGEMLHHESKKLMEVLDIELPCYDPMKNTAAQIVELPHLCHEIIAIISELLSMSKDELIRVPVNQIPGYGVGVLEAPRGLILNEYNYYRDAVGRILVNHSNFIIPTGMNAGGMQADLRIIAQKLIHENASDKTIAWYCDMLLSQYDPCNSCAVHVKRLLKVLLTKYMCEGNLHS